MPYQIVFTPAASRAFSALPKEVLRRVDARILSLAANPRPYGCKKLSEENFYRIRVGDYRIVYEIQDCALLVLVVRIGHRKEIYRS